MEIETEETDRGTLIKVKTADRVALVVRSEDGERIYLPELNGNDSTYYTDNPSGLATDNSGYTVLHPGKVHDIEVIS